ncbi:unnamed protein product, partial [Polarella glacialis]
LQMASGAMGWHEAMNTKETWRTFIEPQAQKLEDTLHRLTGEWSALCNVCEKDMGRGALDHLQSKNHWTALWKKGNNKLPQPEQVLGMGREQPWIQVWSVPGGQAVRFNHFTGEFSVDPQVPG